MKAVALNNDDLSAFCLEMALMYKAGVHVGDGLYLLAEDAANQADRDLLLDLARQVESGRPVSAALKASGCFPAYLLQMAAVGEETGRPEQAFSALAAYYDDQARLAASLRAALLYPALLALLMLLVVWVLVAKVLPVFQTVFQQLGATMSGFALSLLALGQKAGGWGWGLPAILALLAVLGLALIISPGLRIRGLRWLAGLGKPQGLFAQVSTSRFAMAMAMVMASGMNLDQGLAMSFQAADNSPKAARRHRHCRQLLDEGASLPDALARSAIFPAAYSRMLALGFKSGAADTVMATIASRSVQKAAEGLDALLGRLEPALVITAALMVGMILLSVMLPLMNIMSALG